MTLATVNHSMEVVSKPITFCWFYHLVTASLSWPPSFLAPPQCGPNIAREFLLKLYYSNIWKGEIGKAKYIKVEEDGDESG